MDSWSFNRKLLSVTLTFSLLWLVSAQTWPQAAIVPQGTEVEIELLDAISSETLGNGQTVSFKVVRPVAVNGTTILPTGMPISGEVRAVQAAGSWHKAGSFNLVFKPVQIEHGSVIQLDFHRPKMRGTKGETTGNAIGTGLALGYYFPLIPVALIGAARKGKPYNIRAGERYLVYVVSSAQPADNASSKTPSQSATEPPK